MDPYVVDHTITNGPTVSQSKNEAVGANASIGFSKQKLVINNDTKEVSGQITSTGSISTSAGLGTNNSHFTMMDINGDGLPDKVDESGSVYLNLGYKYWSGFPEM